MSTHKHSEAGNELRSLSMIRYDQSMNATTQRSKDSHFWHLTPLPAHRQVHTSHTPTSGARAASVLGSQCVVPFSFFDEGVGGV